MHPMVEEIDRLFRQHANMSKAIPMKKYMKQHFDYFGIKSPLRRTLTNPYLRMKNLPTGRDLALVLNDLWEHPMREMQYVALDMMGKAVKTWDAPFIWIVETLITTKSWWDSVDGLAVIAGSHFLRFPESQMSITDRWIHAENMWLQRSAILFQLRYKEKTDWLLLEKYITTVFYDKQFFIQKACGWALRQYSKTNPEAVRNFVSTHTLSAVCRREAIKYI